MKKILMTLFLFASFFANAQVNVSAGKVVRYQDFKSVFVDARNVDVWLPASYNKNKKYAVLYMHDGQMLFDSTQTWNKQEWGVDETISQLKTENKIKDCIVVGIWNGGKSRHIDYFPQKPFEALSRAEQDTLYAANRLNGNSVFSGRVQSDNYLKFLVNELKPFIDKNFSTNKTPIATFIAGSSMGGLISIYFKLFGHSMYTERIFCFSFFAFTLFVIYKFVWIPLVLFLLPIQYWILIFLKSLC
jgi:predicted alpha/beta superfamily hydrolase